MEKKIQHSEIIKALRGYLKLTQKEFAEKFHLERQQILDIERGKTKISAETVLLIIKELDVNLDWLLTGEGSMFKTATPPVSFPLINDLISVVMLLPVERQKAVLNYAKDQKTLAEILKK